MLQVKGDAFGEENRKLAALGAKPKTVFATKDIDMGLHLARSDQVPVHPAKAVPFQPTRGAGHHAALPGWDYRHLGLP